MKVLACLVALVCVASAIEAPAIVNKKAARENLSLVSAAKAKCAKDVGTTNAGAFSFCLTKELGWQNADGTINNSFIESKVKSIVGDNPNVRLILEECLVAKATPQETATYLISCNQKYAHKPEEILAD